jgi:hypothetical protein
LLESRSSGSNSPRFEPASSDTVESEGAADEAVMNKVLKNLAFCPLTYKIGDEIPGGDDAVLDEPVLEGYEGVEKDPRPRLRLEPGNGFGPARLGKWPRNV